MASEETCFVLMDSNQPIRGHGPGNVIPFDQSGAMVQVTRSPLTNQRPVSSFALMVHYSESLPH